MKKLALLATMLFAASVYAAPPAPYPVTVDSQAQTVPALQVYQAAARTFRVTFKDGTNAVNLAGATPWMWWATGTTARTYYTSVVSTVSSAGGIVDFAFSASQLNYIATNVTTSGTNTTTNVVNGCAGVYGVGVTDSNAAFAIVRQGTFTITASAFGAGVAMPTTTSNINMASYS